MILGILAIAVTATFHPARPTVGDRIVIDFREPVALEASSDYEIVARQGRSVVVRTFQPKPFVLSGTVGSVHFTNLIVPVHSVLKKNDDLKPAPLTPPQPLPYPLAPFLAIGIAALCAIAAWTFVWWRARKPAIVVVPRVPPEERFRSAVLALRSDAAHPRRWAALADATRMYLADTRPDLGSELTSTELVTRWPHALVTDILRQGDLEKFSRQGAPLADFDLFADRALELIAS